MAGKPGMKGGGGARPNSGPKPKPKPVIAPVDSGSDPKKFLQAVMNDETADPRTRMDAAKALMPFMHPKIGEGGKKEERAQAAKKAGAGKFAPVAAPLRIVK